MEGYKDEDPHNPSANFITTTTSSSTTPAAAQVIISAQDKRAEELEELRKRNVAKIMQEQLDGKGLPITKESFYQQQKYQLELIKQQKLDAEANLHNFRNKNVTIADGTKEEIKKKEMEAAALLHSYRGKPEAILSHQVKKFSNVAGSMSKESLQQYVEVVSPSSQSDDFAVNYSHAKSIFDRSPNVDDHDLKQGSGGKMDWKKDIGNTDDDVNVDDFLASLDNTLTSATLLDRVNDTGDFDEMMPQEDHEVTEIHQKNSESSNENSTETTGWVVLEDQKQNLRMESESTKSQVATFDDDNEKEKEGEKNIAKDAESQDMQTWSIRYITISFDLFTDPHNAPPLIDGRGCELLLKLMNDMQLIVEECLQILSQSGVVKLPDLEYKVDVVRSAVLEAARERRPNVVKSFVRVWIPLNVMSSSCSIEQVEMIVRSALKQSLVSTSNKLFQIE